MWIDCEKNSAASDIVSYNVSGILLTLWLTLWEDCEGIVSGDEYP